MEHKNRVDGKNSSLTDSRLERLESVDFTWAKRKGIHSWNEKFVSLLFLLLKAAHPSFHLSNLKLISISLL